ncbi:hypothetical protein AB4427_16425 [Vibrio artabrorum]|uniref:hypothetical protein n=1 Tax=Vibrio artabrorum TaxID=446374 RepID=UPI00355039E3
MHYNKIKLGLISSPYAFYPENTAYKNYLNSSGIFHVTEYDSIEAAGDESDIIIYHCGFLPFWKKLKCPVIMEYHSLSTTRFPKIKNVLKRIINKKGVGYIFLNQTVRDGYYFNNLHCDDYIFRGMGFNKKDTKTSNNYDYDIIYMGTTKRDGVVDSIKKIAILGYSVIIVGCSKEEIVALDHIDNITAVGRVSNDEAIYYASKCQYGLNYTPDTYPLNIQDSTKVIEYCGLGLKVITNRYEWINEFEQATNSKFMSLDKLLDKNCRLEDFDFNSGSYEDYTWQSILKSSNLSEFILRKLQKI